MRKWGCFCDSPPFSRSFANSSTKDCLRSCLNSCLEIISRTGWQLVSLSTKNWSKLIKCDELWRARDSILRQLPCEKGPPSSRALIIYTWYSYIKGSAVLLLSQATWSRITCTGGDLIARLVLGLSNVETGLGMKFPGRWFDGRWRKKLGWTCASV